MAEYQSSSISNATLPSLFMAFCLRWSIAMKIFLRHLDARVSEKRGYRLYVSSRIQQIDCEAMTGTVPCDAFLDSGKTDPSGEVLSCSACMGQIEYTLFGIVFIFGITDKS